MGEGDGYMFARVGVEVRVITVSRVKDGAGRDGSG